jgi:penicillin-binding protein 1A
MPITFEEYDDWTPKNATGETGGMKMLQEGLAHSLNIVTAHVMKEFGPQQVINLARRVGITSPLPPVPAICLGTPDISVYELVGAYSTFANEGVWVQPTYLKRIEDKNGNVIQEFSTQKEEALDEQTAYLMVHLLKKVVNEGTAARLRGKYAFNNELDIIGKTGTTQKHSDGWFVGATPELIAGLWTGWEYRGIHFRTLEMGQGARMAMPVWAIFYKQLLNDPELSYSKEAKFPKPSQSLNVELDCEKYHQKNFQKTDFSTPF